MMEGLVRYLPLDLSGGVRSSLFMNGFNKQSVAVRTGDGRHVTLLEDFVYETKNSERIIVPCGTESDGASIPQPFWNILAPFGPWWLPSVLHDYLYNYTERPRDLVDGIYLEAMESNGVNLVTRTIIYEAVRFGGDKAFTEDRIKELQANAKLIN